MGQARSGHSCESAWLDSTDNRDRLGAWVTGPELRGPGAFPQWHKAQGTGHKTPDTGKS